MSFNPVAQLPTLNPYSLLKMTGFISHRRFSLDEIPDLTQKVAVITGGQAGIGREMTAQLLLHGIERVYILARTESRYDEAKAEWIERKGLTEDDVETRTEFVPCDLCDIRQVKQAADLLLSKLDRLDILINNAAVPMVPDYTLSPQGVETIFATNHLGHFVLTSLLLPRLEETAYKHGDARIVVTTSSFHLACQDLDLSRVTSPTRTKSPATVDSCWRYARSKLANILFTRELASRLQEKGSSKVYANCFFPGNIPTDAMDTWRQLFGPIGGKLFKGTFQMIGQTPLEAAATALFLAASKEVVSRDLHGKYFVPIAQEDKASKLADDKDLAKNLWYWSDHKVSETLGQGWQNTAAPAVGEN